MAHANLKTGYGIGNIKGALQSWRYEFLVVGVVCSAWGIVLAILLPNSPITFWGFNHDEKLLMIARMRRNQTGIEQRRINWGQVKEAYMDYKTWLFVLLGFVGNVPNGGISNFSTLVIRGLGFNTLHTALLGVPQGVIVVIWIGLGAMANRYLPKNSRTLICALFMLPTIAGALGFLLAPTTAYVGRLICLYVPLQRLSSILTDIPQLPNRLLPSLFRALSLPRNIQHWRPIQKNDRLRYDLVRCLRWQHRITILLQDRASSQVPVRNWFIACRQFHRIGTVLCLPICFHLGEQEEGEEKSGVEGEWGAGGR